MRLNIYSQELTKEVTLVRKVAADTGTVHYGVRIFLASPDILHHTPEDDDRSAVTFWIPDCGSFTPYDLNDVFDSMGGLALQAASCMEMEGK